MPFISDKSVQPLSLTQLKGLAALVAPDPITHGDITAQLIVKGETGPPGDAGDVGDDIKYRLSIPTRWCPPIYDDDGFLCEDINPFDRILLLSPISGPGATAAPDSDINLLDMVQPDPTHKLAENGARKVIVLPRREPVTATGAKLLFRLGGDVLPFTKSLIVGATKLGAVFSLKEAVIDDVKACEKGAGCVVHLDFIFRPDVS